MGLVYLHHPLFLILNKLFFVGLVQNGGGLNENSDKIIFLLPIFQKGGFWVIHVFYTLQKGGMMLCGQSL